MTVITGMITIQQDSSTDADIAPIFTGNPFAQDVPARVLSVNGQETYRGQQLTAEVEFVVEMWHLADVTPEMRVIVDEGINSGKTLEVKYVKNRENDGHPQETWLFCSELAL